MPPIPPAVYGSVVFLYESATNARQREEWGASGFLVGVPYPGVEEDTWSKGGGRGFPAHLYVVTAAHVARTLSTARIRLRDGSTEVITFPDDAWVHHADREDVAIAPIRVPHLQTRVEYVPASRFLDRSKMGAVGPGADVFYAGRYVDPRSNKQLDEPTVRAGIMASRNVPVRVEATGLKHDVILVEVRSLKGYSGSPVCVDPYPRQAVMPQAQRLHAWRLLGVDMGHLGRFRPVLEQKPSPTHPGGVSAPDRWVVENSGLMMVVPAWEIDAILNREELVAMRESDEEKLEQEGQEAEGGASLDSATRGPEPERLNLAHDEWTEAMREALSGGDGDGE